MTLHDHGRCEVAPRSPDRGTHTTAPQISGLRSGQCPGRAAVPYDARYPGIVRVEYVLHPFFGRELRVIKRLRYGGELHYEVELERSRGSVVSWMTEKDVCSGMTRGIDPICSLTSCLELQSLLRSSGL